MAHWTAGALGATPTDRGPSRSPAALNGADFVIDTIQVGGARATRIDFEIPRRYGLEYTINDTINVGGVMRGLRSIPVILGIVRDMEELCPDAWFLNYTNPMSMIIWAVTSREPGRRPSGCATPSTGPSTRSPSYIGVPSHGDRPRLRRRQPPCVPAAARARRRGPLPARSREAVRDGRDPRRRPRPGRALPAPGLLPDGVVGAPRRIQPLVHPEGPGRPLPHPDRRVPDRVSRGTSTSSTRRSGSSPPASPSRSSGAASTPR